MGPLFSFVAIIVLLLVHLFVGRMTWLDREGHSPWLSVSAGTALAYVFAYLLPKLSATQDKVNNVLVAEPGAFLRNQVYLIALLGLVCFFWLAWLDERIQEQSEGVRETSRNRLLLNIGGYGTYSLQVGLLVESIESPGVLSYVLATIVLGLHLMGVDHGIRKTDPRIYDRSLRWVFAVCLLVGWAIGIGTSSLDTPIMLGGAFIGGGIMITALREELPGGQMANFLPFGLGVLGSTAAILAVQALQDAG